MTERIPIIQYNTLELQFTPTLKDYELYILKGSKFRNYLTGGFYHDVLICRDVNTLCWYLNVIENYPENFR